MNQNMKAFIRYLIVAICSAIVTFLSSSCTAGLVIGKNQRQHQENNISTKVDSTYYVPTITIRYDLRVNKSIHHLKIKRLWQLI